MAASSSEGQGKTIALVVFVVLTVMTGVLAFYFYDQTDTLTQERNSANQAAETARKQETTTKNNYKEIRGLVYGEQTEEDHAKVVELVRNDLKTPRLGATHKDRKLEYKSFKDALDFLHDELGTADQRTDEQNKEIAKLRAEIESLKETYQTQVDVAVKDKDEKTAELAAETEKFRTTIDQKDREIAQISDERLRALNSKQDAEQNFSRYREKTDSDLKRLDNTIADLREQDRLREQIEFVSSDGQIAEVKPQKGTTVAYINLGSADGLTTGTTFGVYGRDQGGNPYKFPKANIEVTRILDEHRALARVDNWKFSDPVIPGDQLYNALWSPGDRISIGLVGLVYLNDRVGGETTGLELSYENDQFLNLVKQLGTNIDAVYDLGSQKIQGKIDVQTDWLVVGDIPESKENDPQERKEFLSSLRKAEKLMREQARENNVGIIHVRNLLTFMGKQQPQYTVNSGDEYRYLYGKKRKGIVDEGPKPVNSLDRDGKGGK
ncbi:hypothetical protein K2X85_15735 [bacterium]|nr:hypothetical protein [bacterium]